MNVKKAVKRIRRICRKLGFPLIHEQSPHPETLWTGRALYTISQGEGNQTADIQAIMHEVGHWQVAAPSRRRYWDFGFTRLSEGEPEEDLAKMLGVAWEIYLGRDIDTALVEMGYGSPHQTTEVTSTPGSRWYVPEDVIRAIRLDRRWQELGWFLFVAVQLQNLGYMKHGKPTYHTNPGKPWTRTRKRSSRRLATSSRRSAGRVSTRTSSQAKTSARAG